MSELELHQIIYEAILTQIQFGVRRYKDSLSSADETGRLFCVSVDTVQSVYRRLKKEGYISLMRNAGAKVIMSYDDAEIEQHVQTYFSLRKDALLDMSRSIQPLLGNIQWIGLKYASPDTLDTIEHLSDKHTNHTFVMWHYVEHKYVALHNNILMRLARQVYLFFHVPFFNIDRHVRSISSSEQIMETLNLCRGHNWAALQELIDSWQNDLCSSLHHFYTDRITFEAPGNQMDFRWSSYKKPNQLCYSLAMELLISICQGVYLPGSLLPAMEQIARDRNISISTVRRAVGLLCSIGAVKSSRPYGMRVLPFSESLEHCDFSQPVLRQRLIDMLESLQILALSCRSVAELTLRSLSAESLRHWLQTLSSLKERPYYNVLPYVVLDLIAGHVPYQTIRTIYSELLRQLFWGNPLRGMKGSLETMNALLEPYLTGLLTRLEEGNTSAFCDMFEEMMLHDLKESADYLQKMGIQEAGYILVPE